MKLTIKFIIMIFAIAVPVLAQAEDTRNIGFLIDKPDANIVKSGFGECWHTREWKPTPGFDSCGRKLTVAAVEPAPVVAAEPPPVAEPMTRNISFSGDALFAFDKSTLKPEGKVMLDGLVRQLDGSETYGTIKITGHTDRIGSNEYNQKLSERRAQTVQDYLVSNNIRVNRISAEGKGESQPVTNAHDCQGSTKATSVIIACLQPDRRVSIEMTGTETITSSL